jgi:hypothetical protein
VYPCCIADDESVFRLGDRAGEVVVLLALFIMVGFCDREYTAELIFELVDSLGSDHTVEAWQFVSEGDQRVVRPIAFGRCHICILLLVSVGETA